MAVVEYWMLFVVLATGPETVTPSAAEVTPTVEVEAYGKVKKGTPTPHLAGPWVNGSSPDFNTTQHYAAQRAESGAQATVFVFFATTCKPCLKGIKQLAAAATRLKAAGVSVILINSMETTDIITPWLKQHQVPDTFPVMLDEFGGDCERFGCKEGTQLRLPLSVVVDEAGKTRAIFKQEGPDFVDRILGAVKTK